MPIAPSQWLGDLDCLQLDCPAAQWPWPQAVTRDQIATDLPGPIGIIHAGNLSGRLFYYAAGGRIVSYDGTPVLLDGISRPHQSPVELADHSNPCERQHGARTSISGRKSAPSILHGRYVPRRRNGRQHPCRRYQRPSPCRFAPTGIGAVGVERLGRERHETENRFISSFSVRRISAGLSTANSSKLLTLTTPWPVISV